MSSSSQTDTSSMEMIILDEQVVACEIEIDSFDVQYEDEEAQLQYAQNPEDPGTSEYHYQYADDVDPNTVYLFDEETSQMHDLNQQLHEEYPSSSQLPSSSSSTSATTSSSSSSIRLAATTSTSSASSSSNRISSTSSSSSIPSRPQRFYQNQQNSRFYIRKTDYAKERGQFQSKSAYAPIAMHTTFSESTNRNGRKVTKRVMNPVSTEEMESMLEGSQVMQRIQNEINILSQENAKMKKDYEEVQKRADAVEKVLTEARGKKKEAMDEKRRLHRDLTISRVNNARLTKQLCLETPYRF